MDQHQKTITSMLETKTIANHIKDLGKIKTSTEDTLLIQNINSVTQNLQRAHATSKSKSTPFSLNPKQNNIEPLYLYCQKVVGNKKPEWQMLAEKHNWTSPKKT